MKKVIYLIASTILGLILSIITHALLEVYYLNITVPEKIIWTNSCALPLWLQILFPLIFGISFFFIGKVWWHLVYVEKRHWRLNK